MGELTTKTIANFLRGRSPQEVETLLGNLVRMVDQAEKDKQKAILEINYDDLTPEEKQALSVKMQIEAESRRIREIGIPKI